MSSCWKTKVFYDGVTWGSMKSHINLYISYHFRFVFDNYTKWIWILMISVDNFNNISIKNQGGLAIAAHGKAARAARRADRTGENIDLEGVPCVLPSDTHTIFIAQEKTTNKFFICRSKNFENFSMSSVVWKKIFDRITMSIDILNKISKKHTVRHITLLRMKTHGPLRHSVLIL